MFRAIILCGVSTAAIAVSFTPFPASAQETLPTIDIAGTTPAPRGGPVSSDKAREAREEAAYARTVSTGLKTTTPLIDTPRSITIIPKQLLEDNQIINVREAAKFASGVQPTNGFYEAPTIRGMSTGFNFRNNLKMGPLESPSDPTFLDRLEVIKGPASMEYGRITPGGIINYVTKRPKEERINSVQTQFGSWGLSRTTVDFTGPIDDAKTLLYRVVGLYDHADHFVDFNHRDNGRFYGALTWKPTSQFEGNVQVEYYHDRGTNIGNYTQLVPAAALVYRVPWLTGRPLALPRNWTQNEPSTFDRFPQISERVVVYGDWTYRFDEDWKITNRFHYTHNDNNQQYVITRGTPNLVTGATTRRLSWSFFERNTYSLNVDVTGKVDTGPFTHKLLFGFDYYLDQNNNKGDNPQGVGLEFGAFNMYAPVYGNVNWGLLAAEESLSRSNFISRSKAVDYGYYAQDDISYDDTIHLLLGGRYDVAFDWTYSAGGVTNGSATTLFAPGTAACYPACYPLEQTKEKSNPVERQFSPNAGLLFKITPEVSVYASYAKSFAQSLSAAFSFTNTPFQPEKAWQYEIGAKASLFDGQLTASIAAFDLHRQNVVVGDPDHPGFAIQAGAVRSRGVEIEAAGRVTENISIFGAYTYDDALVNADPTRGIGALYGKRAPGIPRHSGNLWAKYDTAPGQSEGWMFGAGVFAVGLRQGNTTNSFGLPGYARLDIMGGYRTLVYDVPVEAQLNITNLTDTTYFESSTGLNALYGAPRTFVGSVKVKF
jgi:iron complex outermembrane recepter protein